MFVVIELLEFVLIEFCYFGLISRFLEMQSSHTFSAINADRNITIYTST